MPPPIKSISNPSDKSTRYSSAHSSIDCLLSLSRTVLLFCFSIIFFIESLNLSHPENNCTSITLFLYKLISSAYLL